MLLNREKLLEKQQIKIEKVDLGDGDFVFVRQMTGRERDRWEGSLLKRTRDRRGRTSYEQSLEDFRAKLAVATICDEQGNPVMEQDDYALLSQNMTAFRLELIVSKAQELNRVTDTDIEDLTKNSEAAQSGDSISVSALNSDTHIPTDSSKN